MLNAVSQPCFLYLVTGPGGKRYVGITSKTVLARWAGHVRESRRTDWKSALHDAIRKYGYQAFEVRELASFATWQAACAAEVESIKLYGTFGEDGYNLTAGGEGRPGAKHSDEFKRATSLRFLGVKQSAETRERIREARANRTPEQREALARKIAAANARRTPEDIARINEAIAASKRGKPRTPEVVAKMKAARWPHLYGHLA